MLQNRMPWTGQDCAESESLNRSHCYCEPSEHGYVQLFLKEKLRKDYFLRSTFTVKTI